MRGEGTRPGKQPGEPSGKQPGRPSGQPSRDGASPRKSGRRDDGGKGLPAGAARGARTGKAAAGARPGPSPGQTDRGCGGAAFRTRRLLETYFDLTLQIGDQFGARDLSDVLMLVLVAIADLRGAPMDAELLAEKLDTSRSTVERRLRPYLDRGLIEKQRQGKSVVYLVAFDRLGREAQPSDGTVAMVRAVMAMVMDVAND